MPDTPPDGRDDSITSVTPLVADRGNRLGKGAFVGEYRIEAIIGQGGMGTVYRAIQPLIGKRVAVKVLAGGLEHDEIAIKRFVLEARAVNEIGHRNLVDIFSFGRLTDGRCYYVMEYLEGRSLARVLRDRGRLEPHEAFPIFLDVGRALDAAHDKGILHRDLKPDNVLLVPQVGGEAPRAKLLDFGLAKLVERSLPGGPLTKAGSAVGTPPYMAPEQCMGRQVDRRADVYALGIMLFETLCGRLPFQGKTSIEVWQGHVRRPPPRPSDLVPSGISPELEAVMLKALEKDPARRYQRAGDLSQALATIASAQAMRPRRAGGSLRPLLVGPAEPPDVLEPMGRVDGADAGSISDFGGPGSVGASFSPGASTPSAAEAQSLRAALGLTIVEPAFQSNNPSQVSALNIDLGAGQPSDEPQVVVPARPVQERSHHLPAGALQAAPRSVPPPLAPPRRASPAAPLTAVSAPARRRRLSLALLLAAAVGLVTLAGFALGLVP